MGARDRKGAHIRAHKVKRVLHTEVYKTRSKALNAKLKSKSYAEKKLELIKSKKIKSVSIKTLCYYARIKIVPHSAGDIDLFDDE